VRYPGKVVLVTGGSRGIGAGIVRAFARAGATVVFCSPVMDEGPALSAEVTREGPGRGEWVRCDVTNEKELRRLVRETVERHGRLDCLVNNAGAHPPHRPIEGFSVQDFRDLLELNVVAVFVACQEAMPHLRKTQGSIVNLASLVATMGQLHATTYVATKGAVLALTKAIAIDEAANGVRANSISPGNIWTPMWREGMDAAPDPAKALEDGEAAQLLGRLGTPEEAGRLAVFLAAEATFTTGVDHLLTGGAELAYGRKARAAAAPGTAPPEPPA
jgi:NAD(P)-dependent dehydrogenase (short-subunit alcohol dehydrogenase family)